MSQCIVFCRTNLDCNSLEEYLCALNGSGAQKFRGKRESGKEGRYSCCVMAGTYFICTLLCVCVLNICYTLCSCWFVFVQQKSE